ncbi:MAG: c-type cytochrome biogenesis protein CcmI [Methylotenera sp.]|nr:c-type cytochrome biogenesis protein CcmI [Methylotenera sp.]
MLIFWIIAFVLTLATLGLIFPAILRPNAVAKTDGNVEKREIFRQQFDEIEQDKRNGILDEAQYEVAKNELERRMLDEVGATNILASNNLPDRHLAAALLVLLPLASVVIYYQIGSPASVTIPAISPLASSAPSTMGSVAMMGSDAPSANAAAQPADDHAMGGDIEPLLGSLKDKLEKNPGDGNGWALLARSYVELRRHAEAVPAYEKAAKLVTNDAQLYADYADALAVVNGHKLAGMPEELVNKALKLDPQNPKALMLAATIAFDRKDYKQAIAMWESVQKVLPADSEMLPEVRAALTETYAVSGEKPSAAAAEKTPMIEQKVASAATAGISGTVRIAPALASKLDPSATVFVFARPTQGSPMPLAIARTTAKDLPYTYHLDDSSAMMPTHTLSQAGEAIIVARISKSGDATAQAGDLQGKSAKVKTVGEGVDVEINEVVQ